MGRSDTTSVLFLAMLFLAGITITSCQTSSLTATQQVQLGDAMNNQNRYSEAIQYYEGYLEKSPSLGVYRNYEMESDVSRKLAHIYSTQGDYQQSLEYLDEALKIDTEINKNQLSVIEDLRLLGITNTYLGKYAEAKTHLEQSLDLTQGMENSLKDQRRLAVADTYISLAHVDLTLGNYVRALNFTDQALEIYDRIDDKLGQVEGHLIKGQIFIARNKLGEAEDEITDSQEIADATRSSTIRQIQAMADIYRLKGELENSLEANIEAHEKATESNIRPQIVWATLRVGDAYKALGDHEKANAIYRQALKEQQQQESDTTNLLPSIQVRMGDVEQARDYWALSGSTIGLGIVNLKLGEQLLEQDNVDSARHFFQSARTHFESVGNVEGTARSKIGLSHSYIGNNDKNAIELLNQVINSSDQPDLLWQSWYQKGKAFESQRDIDSAYVSYARSIGIIEQIRGQLTIEEFRSNYFADKTIVYDRLLNLVLKNGRRLNLLNDQSPVELAFELNERSRSRTFLDLLGNREISSKSSNDDIMLVEEQQLRLKIQQLGRQVQKNELNGKSLGEVKDQLSQSQTKYQEIVTKIKLASPLYQSLISVEPPSLDQIQKTIGEGIALVAYWVGEDNSIAWVISNDRIDYKYLDIKRKALEKEISALRNAMRFKMDDVVEERLIKLHDVLIEPLGNWLAGFDNIGIIPHGPLHFLPFQALMIEDEGYLIEKKNLFYSPSAAVFYYTSQDKPTQEQNVLGIALGNHNIGSHNPLPGTEYEVGQISQFYDQYTPRLAQESTETYFKENAAKFGQIHIATHGVLSHEQPLYSYLLMSPDKQDDGRLTVDEIMDMNLTSNLVTLSACETALGDLNRGDELVGLSRAFLYAGTPAVVVSLWTVDDLSTSLLMTKFHQFINEGEPAYVAISRAQRELLKESFKLSDSRGKELQWQSQIKKEVAVENRFNKSPYYWAPFILIGHPN